jgi:hypothetical protein
MEVNELSTWNTKEAQRAMSRTSAFNNSKAE